ncbi:LysR family transcriptional regulator [Burkholderia plantarii]|uniref:LysR family transcriptional regulator n=1 Tax=Burkholderia plantarii TaxID=41899 RepID=UPI00272C228E|nr:LysR family transcriptional regulator [Burkholderia plantarii]WLE61442.1 LysR family transcriptional regulator [Burkholderia plantarii]
MDRHQAMTVFVAVVETEGFASAARKLNVSPSVITRVVTELERHLGVRLLTRTTRVVRVTEAGARFFEDSRRILAEIEIAEASAASVNATPRGQLTITAPVLFGKNYLVPIVQDYLARYPAVNLDCWFLDRIVNLVDEGVDVGVRIGELPNSSLQAIPVGRVRCVVCAAPDYLDAHGEPRRPEDLAGHTLVHSTGLTSAPEWRFRLGGRTQAWPVQPRLTTTTNDAAVAAALGGLGIAQLLAYQVAEGITTGRLRVLLADYEVEALPVHVVHREGRYVNQKVRAFVDLAVETLRARAAIWNGA